MQKMRPFLSRASYLFVFFSDKKNENMLELNILIFVYTRVYMTTCIRKRIYFLKRLSIELGFFAPPLFVPLLFI